MRSQGISLGTLWATESRTNYNILMRIKSAWRLKQILTTASCRSEMNQFGNPSVLWSEFAETDKPCTKLLSSFYIQITNLILFR